MTIVRPIDFEDPTESEALYVLRSGVLRPGKPRDASVYPGDTDPRTWHIGAWDGEMLMGVGTFLWDGDHLRLRGMAVRPDTQGTGIGAQIIRFAQKKARETNTPMWCNARATAIGFYEKLGWVVEGEAFDVPEVGPHKVMRWTP